MNRLIEVFSDLPLQELQISSVDALTMEPTKWLHYRTDCSASGDSAASAEGLTAWVWTEGTKRAVIAWEWIELSVGVLVLADPNALASNLSFVGAVQGMEHVEPRKRNVLLLNTIVHGLRWQERVLSEIRQPLLSKPRTRARLSVH